MARSDVVVFNGVKFRRYPESKQRSDRVYYSPGIADRERGVRRLHEEIWMAAHGPIPPAHHIHHRDGDSSNNALENLECLSAKDHLALHMDDERRERARRHADAIRPLAASWHRSAKGREWHVQHGARSWEGREPQRFHCERCGTQFESLVSHARYARARTCSSACAWVVRHGRACAAAR